MLFFVCFGAIDCIIGLIFILSRYEQVGILKTLSSIMSLITISAALIYFIRGYRIQDIRLYRLCFITYALSELFLCGTYVHSRITPELGVMAKAITFASILFIGFSHDLGRIKSFVLAFVNFVIELILLYISYSRLPIIYSEQNILNMTTLIENASQFILASIVILMVYTRYSRKQ